MSLHSAMTSPSDEGAHQVNMRIADNDRSMHDRVEALLRQEQLSKHYQDQLESKINGDAVELQRSRANTLHLQRVICGLQYQRLQLETSLAHMAEACRVMARDLGFEKAKVQKLESSLAELHPNIEYILQNLAPNEHTREPLSDDGMNGHLLLENQRQREYIFSLETSLREREEAIRERKSWSQEKMQELRLAGFGEPRPDTGSDEMTRGASEQSSVDIITGNPFCFTQEPTESCT